MKILKTIKKDEHGLYYVRTIVTKSNRPVRHDYAFSNRKEAVGFLRKLQEVYRG